MSAAYPRGSTDQAVMLAQAIQLAQRVHLGQTDRTGQPYIGHVMRVVAACTTDFERTCAALHDVVEDSPTTLDELRAMGFAEAVVSVVATLTKGESEAYEAYIARVEQEPRAWRIKLADLTDNLDLRRLLTLTDADWARIQRYHAAYVRLRSLLAQRAAESNIGDAS
jgi:(p)ppGpp synthase/HD superfamily hydrolase